MSRWAIREDEDGQRPLAHRAVWGYLVPLAVGVVFCAVTWPLQLDRLSYDEVREAIHALELHWGERGFLDSWRESVHPSLVAALTAGFLQLFPPMVALRLPQVLLGLGTIPLVVALGRRSGRAEVGVAAGLLIAASPIWWAYACSISLDLPLAAVTALAALATVGPKRSMPLAILAGLCALGVKRQGLTIVGTAMLLATLGSIPQLKMRPTALVVIAAVMAVLAGAGIWFYVEGGQELFGGWSRVDRIAGAAPTLFIIGVGAVAALVLVYRRVDSGGRWFLRPLLLFTISTACAPFLAFYPSPRYFLPVMPMAALIAASFLWLWGRWARWLRWALTVLLVVSSWGVQWQDLRTQYWPSHRGHHAAASWLVQHVPADDVVLSPCGRFLLLWLEGWMDPPAERALLPKLIEVDRNTCARLEDQLATVERPAWVVIPLYRSIGWPPDIEAHAAAMGLELRALVRRDVRRTATVTPWDDSSVPSIGPRDGVPMLAILFAENRPDRRRLDASAEPVSLATFEHPSSVGLWNSAGVEFGHDGHGVVLEFGGADPRIQLTPLATRDWHHHRALELVIRADEASLEGVYLRIGMRTQMVREQLAELPRVGVDDDWQCLRLDLDAWPPDETSAIRRLWFEGVRSEPGLAEPRIELRELRLVP